MVLRSYRTHIFDDLVALKLMTAEQRTNHLKAQRVLCVGYTHCSLSQADNVQRKFRLVYQAIIMNRQPQTSLCWNKAYKALSPAPRRYGDQTQPKHLVNTHGDRVKRRTMVILILKKKFHIQEQEERRDHSRNLEEVGRCCSCLSDCLRTVLLLEEGIKAEIIVTQRCALRRHSTGP